MDDECFYETEAELLEHFRHHMKPVHKRVVFSNPYHAQAIIAIGTKCSPFGEPFTEYEAIFLCRRLTGLSRNGITVDQH